VELPSLSLLQISLVQRIQLSATSAFLSCLLLMPLPYGLENRIEEAAVFV